LILQGGGALGAYQAGVYEALHEEGIEPDWVAGVSIGAINASIIAGNSRSCRIDKLKEFWHRITERKVWHYTPDGDIYRQLRNATSSMMTMTMGLPGFFAPHPVNPWLSPTGARTATSFYTSDPLRSTLLELIDFSLINDRSMRFAVGAVNVLTGNFICFDNSQEEIVPEHIMDGGIVSNTPLQHVLDNEDRLNTLVFQVDLFSARGELPRDMESVLGRHKDIMYSSRTRHNTDVFRRTKQWNGQLYKALCKISEDELSDEQLNLKEELSQSPEITILHMIYQQKAYEGHAKDYDFSGTSMREHWQSGLEDTRRSLKQRHWLEMPPAGSGIVVHDVHAYTG
jgi:NTE family protein